MNEVVIWELLAKYLANECTEDERRQVVAWIEADARNERYYQQLRQIWAQSPNDYSEAVPDSKALWQKLQTSLGQERALPVRRKKPPVQRVLHTWRWQVAAAILFALGLGWFAYLGWQETRSVVQWTHAREKKEVTLPDGTHVWLNEGSKLAYPTNFSPSNREVSLEGEAYFEVVHLQKSQSFIVRTEETKTTVLGTSFNVKSYPDASVRVTVVTGRVAFAKADTPSEKVLLTKHFSGSYDPRRGHLQKERNGDLNFMAWKTGVLTFDKTPIKEVIEVVSNYYHRDLRLDDAALGTCRFTGTFDQQSLEKVLQTIRLTFDATTTVLGDTVVIQDINCQ